MTGPGPDHLAEARLRLLVQQAPAFAWTADPEARLTSLLWASSGVTSEVPAPGDLASVFGRSEPGDTLLAAHALALDGSHSEHAVVLHGRVYDVRIEPLRGTNGIEGSVGVGVDVTERRQAERDAIFAHEGAIQCIVRAIELRDVGTDAHGDRMNDYCLLLARAAGLRGEDCQALALAARLHDMGKLTVPDGVLLKPGALTDEEREVMRRHCRAGHEILSSAGSKVLGLAATIALTHHEWWDGSGYPAGLAGEEIPLPGRIAAIADVFDALTSDRPYRPALAFQQAKSVLSAERGTHFDPELLDLFLESPLLPDVFRREP